MILIVTKDESGDLIQSNLVFDTIFASAKCVEYEQQFFTHDDAQFIVSKTN